MEKQSKVSGGKGLALAGSAVAAVLVLLGLVYSVRVAPPEVTPEEATVSPAPQATPDPVASPAPDTETASQAESDPSTEAQAQDAAQPEPEPEQATEPATQDTAVTADDTAPADTAVTDAAQADSSAPEAAADSPAESSASTEEAPEEQAATLQDAAEPAPVEGTTASTASQTATEAPASTEATRDPALPSFDTVRLAPDGEAVVAGRALAGSTVDILLDGTVVGTATTGGDGAFAAFLSLPSSDTPRVMTLAITKDGAAVSSDQQVIIAPIQRPEVAVAADTTASQSADPQPETNGAATETTAATAPAVLLADTTGVRVLQPATPSDPGRISGVALDVISYTSLGDVLLQGRATAAATVLIYLDNALVTSAPVGADGIWSTSLPGVSPGIYTLRLDEVDGTGKVLSRIETPFKREDRDEVAAIAAASAPAATAPADTQATQATAIDATASAPAQEVASATEEAPASAPNSATAAVRVVTVQPGNTLWAIARESYGEGPLFVRVFEANRDRIRDPDLIYPGQIFEIPE